MTGAKNGSALFRFNGQVQGFATQGVAINVLRATTIIVNHFIRTFEHDA